jgi:hypothetical protein
MYSDVYNCAPITAEYGKLHCTQCDMDGMQRIVQRVPGGYIVEGLVDVNSIIANSSPDIQPSLNIVNNVISTIIYWAIINNTASCQINIDFSTAKCNEKPCEYGKNCFGPDGLPCPNVTIFNSCNVTPTMLANIQNDVNNSLNKMFNDTVTQLATALNKLIPGLIPASSTTKSSSPTLLTQIQTTIDNFVNPNSPTTNSNIQPTNNIQTIITNMLQNQKVPITKSYGNTSTGYMGIDNKTAIQIIQQQLALNTQYMGIFTSLTGNNQTQQAQASSGLAWWVWLIIIIAVIIVVVVVVVYFRKRNSDAKFKLST